MKTLRRQKGFALIELLVATSLFLIVATIAAGALVSLFSTNRQSRSAELLTTNLEFIMEDIARNARVGSSYYCNASGVSATQAVSDCTNATSFGFLNEGGEWIRYQLSNGTIQKSVNGSAYMSLNPPLIEITSFTSRVTGSSKSDSVQPYLTVSIKGTTETERGEVKTLSLQSTIEQRLLDISI